MEGKVLTNNINLLIVSRSSEIIEELKGSITAEMSIQTFCSDSDGELITSELKQTISTTHCIVLLYVAEKQSSDIKNVLSLKTNAQHLTIIAVQANDSSTVVEAMQQGAADLIESSNTEHLNLVIEREFTSLKQLSCNKFETKSVELDFTGLLSRRNFLQLFDQQKKLRNEAQNHAILYLQLDNFSWINESIGIDEGDLYLKSIANLIKSLIEDEELATRYQGGSFILVIKAESTKKILAKADMIREAIAEATLDQNGILLSSTTSVGIRILVETAESQEISINRAFEASQTARSNGGNSIHIYQNSDEQLAEQKINNAWDVRIRDAFDNDQFQLFYQPIVSLKGDTKARYEVLIRMIDDEGNIVAPGTFLPSAERAGLMADIDRRVITYSLQKAEEQSKNGIETEMFIKLSSKSLDDKSMASWIGKALKEYKIENHNIVFELTESLALTQLAQVRRLVDSLKKLGCKITLDHFGKRVKSFSLLNQLDINYLKLDPSLVSNLSENKSSQVIVKKIFRDAQNKNINVMAVSVQDVNTLPTIWHYGFDFVQGYFLQIPDENMEYDFSNLII